MKKPIFYVLSLFVILLVASCGSKEAKFESIFNGTNFDGWETYLGVPDPSVDVPGMERNEEGVYTQPIGLNKDPLKVFSIKNVDGEPALYVTGQVYGSFATVKEYENYHLRLEVKWGNKKWAPREDKPMNAGVLYHSIGEFGAGLGVWKMSHECQVMETMFGDSYRMSNTYCDVTASRTSENERYTFDKKASKVSFGHDLPAGPICSKNPMNEKDHGEWNVIEVLCYEGTSVHVINGKVNMINTDSHIKVDGKKVPLTKGAIQLQSEGAEIYYRKMEIRPITGIPDQYLK
ncbi:MAG: DUF1080 domain-containing protein [Bacteroidales bacterium]|jgi:hypothetical protein|nr:DUF1080 domain-containing protein [Bacteroidales bacterium]